MTAGLQNAIRHTALVVVGAAALTAVAAKGTFTIDDSNYLATVVALRSGSLSLQGTAGLPQSPEWYAFDPAPPMRGPPRMPVTPTAPPLWAPFALPFAAFGFTGLIFLNALCFLVTVLFVHRVCAMHATTLWAPRVAAVAFGLGTYCLEYALGIWPHMFSVMVVTLACAAAARARLFVSGRWAFTAGVLAAVAAGIRYQNAVLVVAIGAGLVLVGERRMRQGVAFALGAAGPLLLSALINLQRLGIFHPATKGHGYAAAGAATLQPVTPDRLNDVALSFWSRVVDFSVHPPIPAPGDVGLHWTVDPDLGVFVTLGAVKKALLQSAPWVALAFVLMLLAWRRSMPRDGARQESRALSLLVLMLLATFTVVGTGATDGLSFNARYLLELLPGAAIVVGWWADRSGTRLKPWLVGALGGTALVAVIGIAEPYSLLRSELIHWMPLLLVVALVGSLFLARRTPAVVAGLIATCVVWAFGLHVIDDLPPSQRLRRENGKRFVEVSAVLPHHCALFVYSVERDALWPLWGYADCLVLDLGKDGGRDGPMLTRALLSQGRRVFVDDGVPAPIMEWMLRGAQVRQQVAGARLSELLPE